MSLLSVPKHHPEAGIQRVGGRWMAATADERFHTFEDADGTISEVGERIIALVDGRRTVADIAEVVGQEFEVEQDAALADTVDFIGLLVEKNVLVV